MLECQQCWHFNIYAQDKFHALLSWAWKSFFLTLGPDLDPKLLKTQKIFLIVNFEKKKSADNKNHEKLPIMQPINKKNSSVIQLLIYTMHDKLSNFLCFTSFCAHLCAVPINFNCNDENKILGKWNHETSDAIL